MRETEAVEKRTREREREMTRVQERAKEKKTAREAKRDNIKQLLLIALSIHIMPAISPISLSALRARG